MIERAIALQAELSLVNLSWHAGEVAQLRFPADQFDVVLTRYSLHHFLRPIEVLAEIARVCKPLGRVVVLEASFPRPGDAGHVRALIEADIGVDDLGVGVHRKGNSVWLAYPIADVAGIKAAKPVASLSCPSPPYRADSSRSPY